MIGQNEVKQKNNKKKKPQTKEETSTQAPDAMKCHHQPELPTSSFSQGTEIQPYIFKDTANLNF